MEGVASWGVVPTTSSVCGLSGCHSRGGRPCRGQDRLATTGCVTWAGGRAVGSTYVVRMRQGRPAHSMDHKCHVSPAAGFRSSRSTSRLPGPWDFCKLSSIFRPPYLEDPASLCAFSALYSLTMLMDTYVASIP